ncbi:MAG: DNA polymerase III subunit gamma/tau [Patescibacteria group bacterium]
MAEALYRKYRPSTFAAVAEQKHVVRTVSNQLAAGKVAHAYLFSGPRGVGKTTIARLLAKALNCEGREPGSAEPCNQCSICVDANAGRFLDTVEIDAASQTKVEETRENIIENVRFAPSRGKYKVFIIDEVHMLSTSSFNALLKTLEEPPSHVVFILATTELHKIPATIISRCQRFDFHRIPAKEMIERLQTIAVAEGADVEFDVMAAIARLSEGCLRDAESLLGQVLALGEKKITLEVASLIIPATYTDVVTNIAEALTRRETGRVLEIVNKFVEEGGSMRHLVDELMEFSRSMMFASLGDTHLDKYDEATLAKLQEYAKRLPPFELQQLLDVILTARGRSAPSQYPQLPLEIALVQFCLGAQAQVAAPAAQPRPTAPVTPAPIASPSLSSPAMGRLGGAVISPRPHVELPKLPDAPVNVAPLIVAANSSETDHATDADVDEVRTKWGRCVSLIAEKNIAMPLMLNNAEVLRAENGRIIIGFKYVMHVDKMNEIKNIRLIEDAITAITMRKLSIVFVHNKTKEDEAVADLLEAFGGAVV